MKHKDSRIKLMNEVLNGIKVTLCEVSECSGGQENTQRSEV